MREPTHGCAQAADLLMDERMISQLIDAARRLLAPALTRGPVCTPTVHKYGVPDKRSRSEATTLSKDTVAKVRPLSQPSSEGLKATSAMCIWMRNTKRDLARL